MTDRLAESVFAITVCGHVQNTLDSISVPCSVSPTYFSTIADCRELIHAEECDLLIVDLDGNAPDALQFLIESKRLHLQMPALALVDHGDIPTAVQAIKAGATDCLEKPVDRARLVTGINDLLGQTAQDLHHLGPTLTPTEETVLRLLLEGKTNHEAARALHRSPRTIEVHRGHIMHKLGVSNMVELMKKAIAMGFLDTAHE